VTRRFDELHLDGLFWSAFSTDEQFRTWVLNQTAFSPSDHALVLEEKWHQRWFRDPDTGRESETDILAILVAMSDGSRHALHIENKPPHRTWEPQQAENYKKRALDRRQAWQYDPFQTVLLAPRTFISRWRAEAAQFDVLLTYEDVGLYIPEFADAAGAGIGTLRTHLMAKQ
jgi:hypothetical protein